MSLLRQNFRPALFGGAMLIAGTAGAIAADMPDNRPLPPPTRTLRQVEVSTGWYLRGDVAYRLGRSGGMQPSALPATTSEKLGNSAVAGIGAGIKSDWLRTDFTADIGTSMKYEAQPGNTSAKVSASTFMFNGYLDLGTWYRATPYIGAGAGAARVSISDYTSTVYPPLGSADATQTKWNFAYAGMAGIAYGISPNTMVDLGYRYINLGDVSTGNATGSMTLKRVAAHEVRVGLRWSFDDHSSRY